ncbi:MAG: hypothetical protein ABEJ98_00475 [Candidatus Nanohaloarchaea archaeon]
MKGLKRSYLIVLVAAAAITISAAAAYQLGLTPLNSSGEDYQSPYPDLVFDDRSNLEKSFAGYGGENVTVYKGRLTERNGFEGQGAYASHVYRLDRPGNHTTTVEIYPGGPKTFVGLNTEEAWKGVVALGRNGYLSTTYNPPSGTYDLVVKAANIRKLSQRAYKNGQLCKNLALNVETGDFQDSRNLEKPDRFRKYVFEDAVKVGIVDTLKDSREVDTKVWFTSDSDCKFWGGVDKLYLQ